MPRVAGPPSDPEAHEPPDGAAGVAAASATVAIWTLVSRATGFIRVAVVAGTLGATYLGNTYGATNYLPNLAHELVAGSVLGSLLVPQLVRALDLGGREKAERVAGAYLGVVLAAFAAVAAVVALAAPLILEVFSAGISDRDTASDQQHVGWLLLCLQAWQIPLYGVVQIATAAQTARGRFALAAAAPSIENIGVMAVMVTYAVLYGTGNSVGGVGTGEILLLGGGSTLAVGLHAATQWWGARRAGITLRPRWDVRSPEIKELLVRARLAFGLSGLSSARTFGALAVANTVPGGVLAFQVGLNFLWLPASLAARPVAVAIQPVLARLHHRDAARRFREEFVRGMSVVLFLTVPAGLAYIALSEPLAHLVAYAEFDTTQGLALVVATVAGLGLGVVGDSAYILAVYASFARDDAHAPFAAMRWGIVVAALGMAVAMVFFEGSERLLALAIGYSLSVSTAAWRLSSRVGEHGGAPPGGLRSSVLRAGAAGTIMAGPAYLLGAVLPGPDPGKGVQLACLALAAVVCLGVYGALQRWWRAPELDFFLGGRFSRAPSTQAPDRP